MTKRLSRALLPVLLTAGLVGSTLTGGDPEASSAMAGISAADCPMTAAGARSSREASAQALLEQDAAFLRGHSGTRFIGFRDVPPAKLPHVNFIDDEVLGAMEQARISPAALSSDAEFLRRVTLDLTGRLPDPATVQSFLADTAGNKRDKMIDTLLASDAFIDRWTFFYDELFRVTANSTSGRLGTQGRNTLHAYFQKAVKSGKPYDQMAREVINGMGDSNASGPPNFTVRELQNNGPIQDTDDNLASTTGSVFLGTSIFCLSCHHGVGHTTQINIWLSNKLRQDFWGMSAFYARTTLTRVGGGANNFDYNVAQRTTGDYLLNTTTGNKTYRLNWAAGLTSVSPKFILTGEAPQAGEDYRAALARMTTAHPQFAKAAVNYLWKELFTLAIVEPPDGFDLARQDPGSPPPAPWTIQPTHPNLLVGLAAEYRSSGYDLRSILRTMARSNAYQLSSSYQGWNESYAPFFARHFARRLSAEEMLDAITAATGVPATLPVTGFTSPVALAMQLPDPLEPGNAGFRSFLDTFGRGNRDDVPRSSQGSITQSLASLNNRIVTDRIKATAPGSTVKKLVDGKASPAETVTALYLATLSRPPSPSELAAGVALSGNLKPGQTAASVTEDLQHALLNKLDFLFNY